MSKEIYDRDVNTIRFVFLDFETTGFSPENDRIIEIGALKVVGREIINKYDKLIDPKIKIPIEASRVSGLTNINVDGKETVEEALPSFLKFLKGSVIVAHNSAFDVSFLRASLARTSLGDIHNEIVDTIKLAKKAFPKIGKFSLQYLSEKLNLPKHKAHRALDDCYTCMHLFNKCCDRLNFMGILKFKDIAG